MKRTLMAACAVALVLVLCGTEAVAAKPASQYNADVAVRWFALLHDIIKVERMAPPAASRIIGYAGVSLYESIVPGVNEGKSLGGQLNELGKLPSFRSTGNIHWPSAANAAMARTLRGLFAGATPDSLARIDALEQAIEAEFQASARFRIHPSSAQWGRTVADAILAWAGSDGYATLNNCPYTAPMGPGLWEPTPPLFRPAHQPCWGQLRPFVLSSGGECAPPPPPAFSTTPGSDFYAEGQEVYNTTSNLTSAQMEIALFWADDPGPAGTPPGHWVSIVGQLAARDAYPLDKAAEAYARVGIAVADAFIACWATKFDVNLLRPITYIQAVFDPNWTSPIGTPAFPEYTSGHSVQSGAASSILTDMLGRVAFTDHTHDARGLAPRSFPSFVAAAQEAAISRLYGGIHYRAAIEQGLLQGKCIARAIEDEVNFGRDNK